MTPASGWTGGWPKPSPSPGPLAQKYIRIKRVKLNGKGGQAGHPPWPRGICSSFTSTTSFSTPPTPENAFLSVFKPQLDILYEDENLLPGQQTAGAGGPPPTRGERVNTLITHIQAYLYQKRSGALTRSTPLPPALCNRIDRNTGGIVIAAKNAETLRIMNQKIRDREVEKSYLCLILGSISPAEGKLEGYLLKDEVKKQVSVHKKPVPGGRTAVTPLPHPWPGETACPWWPASLVTGRTHQIRAQFAAAGHPPLGTESMAGQGQQAVWPHRRPGFVLLPAHLPLHHRRRLPRTPQRPHLDGGPGGLRGGVLPWRGLRLTPPSSPETSRPRGAGWFCSEGFIPR